MIRYLEDRQSNFAFLIRMCTIDDANMFFDLLELDITNPGQSGMIPQSLCIILLFIEETRDRLYQWVGCTLSRNPHLCAPKGDH